MGLRPQIKREKIKSLRTGQTGAKGVSPVIGVILLTAIVVILAAVLAMLVSGMGDTLHKRPPLGSFDEEYVATGIGNTDHRPYVNLTFVGGEGIDADRVIIKDDSGNTIKWSNVWTGNEYINATESVHIDGFGSDHVLDPICQKGQTYWVIYKGEDETTFVLMEWTVPRNPNLPPSASADSNDDGIPDWC